MKSKLQEQVEQLTRETEGYEDALNYVEDIANDLGIKSEEVIEELKKQYGKDLPCIVIYAMTKKQIPDPQSPTEGIEVFGPFKDEEEAEGWIDHRQYLTEWPDHFCITTLTKP